MKDNRNTAFGWILFSGVIALGASSISSMYFHADDNELPEGAEPGFFIQADEEEGTADAGPPFANLLAAGSAYEADRAPKRSSSSGLTTRS